MTAVVLNSVLSAVIDRRYSFEMPRSIFLRGLALIYLIAFLSLLPQLSGLIGSYGILPAHDFLEGIHSDYGGSSYALFPTLAWLSSSDTFLFVIVWSGIVLSVLLLIGVAPLPATIGLLFSTFPSTRLARRFTRSSGTRFFSRPASRQFSWLRGGCVRSI